MVRRPDVLLLIAALLPAGCSDPPDAPPAEPVGAEELAELTSTALAGTRVSSDADTLLDHLGARMSALPSGDSAQAWVERTVRGYGLSDVRSEPFPLLGWDRREASLVVVAPEDAAAGDELRILSLGHVGSHEVQGPLVDAGYGTAEELEALGDAVEGAVVLADVGAPEGYGRGVHRTEKVTLAAGSGAVAFVQLNTSEGPLIPVGVATLGDEAAVIPAVAGDRATGERLRRLLATHDDVRVRLAVDNWMERVEAANVLAEIGGTSDEAILAGAHLDSWDLAQGAVDNGSGSLALLDAARALAEHVERTGRQPYRTIRFAWWMGEELGLYGSRHHADARLQDGSLGSYAGVLNLDVVGAPVGLGAMGRPESASFLERVRQALLPTGIELDEEMAWGGGIYSDHQPFLMQGVPVFSIRTRQRPEASGVSHTTADVRAVIDESGISRTAAVAAALLWALANEPELPVNHWPEEEIGPALEELGVRDPLERAGEWRWP